MKVGVAHHHLLILLVYIICSWSFCPVSFRYLCRLKCIMKEMLSLDLWTNMIWIMKLPLSKSHHPFDVHFAFLYHSRHFMMYHDVVSLGRDTSGKLLTTTGKLTPYSGRSNVECLMFSSCKLSEVYICCNWLHCTKFDYQMLTVLFRLLFVAIECTVQSLTANNF